MEEKNININLGGFSTLLTIVFLVLKLCGVITWSWFWVLSPIIFSVGIIILIFIIIGVIVWINNRLQETEIMGNTLSDYLKSIAKYPLLSAEEELDLARRYTVDGDADAFEKMVNCNLRLVVHIAKHYQNVHLSLLDLIGEGNLGLITAVEKYDYTLGNRFSTCAVQWIKQAISKAITDKGRNVRIPAHMYQLMSQYRKAINDLGADGHLLTDEEIAAYLKIDTDKIKVLRQYKHDTLSLDMPLGDESEDTLGDLQADGSDTPIDYTERGLRAQLVKDAIATLKPRSQQIVKMRYGLGADGDPVAWRDEHTLEQVGAALGITRERVRQIEKESMTELRRALEKYNEEFAEYM